MEFAHLGTRCSVSYCQQHDFLPFTCDACKQIFCLEHRQYIDHNCQSFQKQDKVVPICPLCEQPVPWYPVEAKTVDEVVDHHIRAQKCPKVHKRVKNNEAILCQASSCKHTASLKCKFCRNHRNELDHPCSMDQTNGKIVGNSSSSSNYSKQNSKLAQIHQQRQQKQTSSSTTSLSSNSTVVQKPLTNVQKMKVLESKFGNLKSKPIGQETIEREDRIFLDVYFPTDTSKAPLHMFFSKRWRVGKVLDRICVEGKVENKNTTEQDSTKRLNLFHIQTFLKLPTDKTFQELLDASHIKMNDGVILERGEELRQEVREIIENTKKNPDQATCLIN